MARNCFSCAGVLLRNYTLSHLLKYELLHEGLSTSPIARSHIESRRKADDLMLVCSKKEVAGDLHAALLCCNQAACMDAFLVFLRLISTSA